MVKSKIFFYLKYKLFYLKNMFENIFLKMKLEQQLIFKKEQTTRFSKVGYCQYNPQLNENGRNEISDYTEINPKLMVSVISDNYDSFINFFMEGKSNSQGSVEVRIVLLFFLFFVDYVVSLQSNAQIMLFNRFHRLYIESEFNN